MKTITVNKHEPVALIVPIAHKQEQYLDTEDTTIVIPHMGYVISDGVLFIQGKDDSWIWMCCENVEEIVTPDINPKLCAELQAYWDDATK